MLLPGKPLLSHGNYKLAVAQNARRAVLQLKRAVSSAARIYPGDQQRISSFRLGQTCSSTLSLCPRKERPSFSWRWLNHNGARPPLAGVVAPSGPQYPGPGVSPFRRYPSIGSQGRRNRSGPFPPGAFPTPISGTTTPSDLRCSPSDFTIGLYLGSSPDAGRADGP